MAGEENVGSIVFEVGMETTAMLSGGKQVNRVLSEIEASLDASINSFKKMDTQVSATAQAVSQSTRSFGGLKTAMQQGGYQIQDFVVQVQGGQSALVALSQQGSQLLGVFGAGGAVAGALLTIGTVIVGSLIAGMDNAAVSTKALTEAQKRLADIFQVSSNGVVVLSDKFAKLAEVSENAARAQLTMALIDAQNVIKSSVQSVNELGDALGTWKAPLSAAISQMDRLKAKGVDVKSALDELGGTYEGNIAGLNQLNQVVTGVSKAFGISSDDAIKLVQALADVRQNANPDTIAALRDTTVDLSQKYGFANKALSEFTGKVGEYSIKSDQAAESTRLATEMLNGHKVASQADADAVAQNTKALETYIQMIKDEGATIAFTARQKALYRAEQLGASKEDKDAINTSFDKIEAFKSEQAAKKDAAKETRKAATTAASEAKKSEAQQESVTRKLENLRAQSDLTTESIEKRRIEEAGLRAQQSLGSSASQQQLAEAKALGEANEQAALSIQKRREAEQGQKFAKQEIASNQSTIDPATGKAIDPVAQVNLQEQQKLEALAKYQEIDKQNTALYEQAKIAIQSDAAMQRKQISDDENEHQRQNMSALLGATSDFFGQMAGAIGDYAGESSAAYKTLFAISKGFAIAQASMNLVTAISNAAALPWPANIPAIAFAAAQGANLVSQIRGAKYGGGRENGGPVSAGSMYRVGEKGKPEIYQAGSGKQYMIPGDNGKVISNKDMQSGSGGGGGVVVNINNYTSSTVDAQASPDGKGGWTVDAFVYDISNGGPASQAIEQYHQAPRKARG
jgi:hypothetical protein